MVLSVKLFAQKAVVWWGDLLEIKHAFVARALFNNALARGAGRLMQDGLLERPPGVTRVGEGPRPAEQLVQQHPERVDVGPDPEGGAVELLG